MSIGLVGKKSGMSRLFQEDGTSVPVTIISVAANFVADIKTPEKHGYSAVVVSKNSSKNLTKSSKEFFKKQNLSNGELFEFRTEETSELKIGHHLTADIFEIGKMVDVSGISKGKGYAGVIKRHNFAMQDATHGNSLAHRAHGSIGQCQTPGRVWKGKKMSGHMGHEKKTIQSLELMGADVQNNLLYVKGAVPGFNGSTLKITNAVKQKMKLDLLNIENKKTDVQISETTFGKDFNETLVHQAVVTYLAGSRQGSHKQKTRSEVRGGGKKPYRQKGTGRARAGTIRSPIWRGGGVAFASTPRDYSKKINKKMYRAAISSIFSELHRQERLVAIEQPKFEAPKTKEMNNFLEQFNLKNVLIILDEMDTNLYLSARNIPHVDIVTVKEINPVILLRSEKVAVTPAAFKLIEAWV